MQRSRFVLLIVTSILFGMPVTAQIVLEQSATVETQPLIVQCQRLAEAMEFLGSPFDEAARQTLDQASAAGSADEIRKAIQAALDPYCLVEIEINPESRVKVNEGPARRELDQNGWRVFLVKVHNEAGVTAPLKIHSPQAAWIAGSPESDVADRWLDTMVFGQRPMSDSLSGIELEYRPVMLYSRDAGKRTAIISFDVGQGTQDIGFRNDVSLTFDCRPAMDVSLEIKDENGQPTTVALEITDDQGRIYPSNAKRLAPDLHFQRQVYRGDGELIQLPPGVYQVRVTRGPEYLPQSKIIRVDAKTASFAVDLRRWVDPSQAGWWSGDHHIHAAGCAHYADPTQGVHAPDMMRQCLGEDLKVGANLTWGPCFDYQKQFFTGAVDEVSQYPYLLRYDIEVSGFGSHESGHLCLLRLQEQMYPGGDSTSHWPTLGLSTLRWAQKQGAVCGPAHSGFGLEVNSNELPNYIVPPFNGIGANEYIVNVTHLVEGPDGTEVPAVDFMSLCDTPMTWELNIWYHTLNCGFRTRVSGETDFPCIYGERVGLGRSYVKLDGDLNYDDWCEGISRGASYVSDGRSHLMEFRATVLGDGAKQNEVALGESDSELRMERAGVVQFHCAVAALLAESPTGEGNRPLTEKPYWHLERARIVDSRNVPVELIVNGVAVGRQLIVADGTLQQVTMESEISRSSWVALRIPGSSHTNPIFIVVDDKPIRASSRSAEWCLAGVDQCWSQKSRFIRGEEIPEAKTAYEHAKTAYREILKASVVD